MTDKKQTLEKKVDPLSLGDKAIQAFAPTNPLYIKTAIEEYKRKVTEKLNLEAYVLNGYFESLENSCNKVLSESSQNEGVHLDDVLKFYFNSMKHGYAEQINDSKVSDINNALRELGYEGPALEGNNDITVKQVEEKLNSEEKKKNANDEDKLMYDKINYAKLALKQCAEAKLNLKSIGQNIEALNELGKKKEEAKKEDKKD